MTLSHIENFFRNKAIDLYVAKRKKGLTCEKAYMTTFLQLHESACLSIAKLDDESDVSKAAHIARALLEIKKDNKLSQKMEDAFVFSSIGNVKPEHLKLIMQ
jgi:hypothetical protein